MSFSGRKVARVSLTNSEDGKLALIVFRGTHLTCQKRLFSGRPVSQYYWTLENYLLDNVGKHFICQIKY